MNFLPNGDRIVVKRTEIPEKTPGGVLVVQSSTEKPVEGTIVAVGNNCCFKLDTRVLFGKYAGTEVKINDEDYVILKEDDVLGQFT